MADNTIEKSEKERILSSIEKLEPLKGEYGDYIYRESVIRIIKEGG